MILNNKIIRKIYQQMDEKNLIAPALEDPLECPSSKIIVRITIDTLPPLLSLKLAPQELEGYRTVYEMGQILKLNEKHKEKDQLFFFLKDAFLVNPFEKLSDLANCFGSKMNEGKRELNFKVSKKNAWG